MVAALPIQACGGETDPHPGGQLVYAEAASEARCASLGACASVYELTAAASGSGSATVAGVAIFLSEPLAIENAVEFVLQCDGHGPVGGVVSSNHAVSERVVRAGTGFPLPGGTRCELSVQHMSEAGSDGCIGWFAEVELTGRSKVEPEVELSVEELAPNCDDAAETGPGAGTSSGGSRLEWGL